jgi:hypothetical protein
MFSSSNGAYGANALPQTIELIDVSRNPVSGPLPFVGDEYASLASIDLSFTNVSGM